MALQSTWNLTAVATAAIAGFGAFSRFTHGRFTPGFYAYQLDRAPDDASTRAVPYIDTLLTTLILLPATRVYGLFAFVAFQGIGLVVRLQAKKDPFYDVALLALTTVALYGSLKTRQSRRTA